MCVNISKLKVGDKHYMAYVGPPTQYDIMGATQFRLLCSLGLRSNHHLLDVGCGSLRAGRLFIVYLDEDRYFGIEPNEWLIKDAIQYQIGADLIHIKKPRFNHNSDFATDIFSQEFNFILAQSIFSHAGRDLISKALENFKKSLKPNGLIVVTFVEEINDFDGNGWEYPGSTGYRRETIKRLAKEVGLFIIRIPWYHPRTNQAWYLLANSKSRLPKRAVLHYLSGVVLSDPEFIESWKSRQKIFRSTKGYIKQIFPQQVMNSLKRMLQREKAIRR